MPTLPITRTQIHFLALVAAEGGEYIPVHFLPRHYPDTTYRKRVMTAQLKLVESGFLTHCRLPYKDETLTGLKLTESARNLLEQYPVDPVPMSQMNNEEFPITCKLWNLFVEDRCTLGALRMSYLTDLHYAFCQWLIQYRETHIDALPEWFGAPSSKMLAKVIRSQLVARQKSKAKYTKYGLVFTGIEIRKERADE